MNAPSASLQVLRAAERAPVPWKNGGGVTREVAAHPPGSSLDEFDWRVSIADVRAASAFSSFPGVDRRMAVVSGLLSIAIGEGSRVTLMPESDAVAFAGEVPVFAQPLAGPVTDLNVMTRRARCAADLTRFSVREPVRFESPAGTSLLLVALCQLLLREEAGNVHLAPLDAVLLGTGGVTIEAPAAFWLARIAERPPQVSRG